MSDDAGADVGRARHGIGGLARRIRPVGRLSVGILPDGRGHLQRRVLHALRFEPEFAAVVPRPVAIWYATWPCATRLVVQVLDGQRAPAPPGAVRASIPHVPAYLLGYHDGRRELLDIFARRSARADELAEVGAAFAPLVGWGHRVVWGDVFRGSPVLPNVEFLRGYAGCPVPEGLELAVDLALDAAGGHLELGALADHIALATGLDERLCTGQRTFTQIELRRALAERRLQFHLEGRHVGSLADNAAPIAPREPDFGALPSKDRDLAQRRYDAIGPLLGKVGRTAAEVRDRAHATGVGERTLWNWLRWYEPACDIRALLPRIGERCRGRPTRSEELHEIIAERLEARWLKRPPWPLTDVALDVVAEVERRNRDRPTAEHIPLTRTPAGQVSLAPLVRMVQRQARRGDAYERIAAQQHDKILPVTLQAGGGWLLAAGA